MYDLRENDRIVFKSPADANVKLTGRIRGIALNEQAVIGITYIVEVGMDSFPDYGYSCITVTESSILNINGVSVLFM
jgi:hypothetical protein